jgi:hypothetical protein|tara:strand:+ start:257 stop:478 length:222 start_codon:yes stop_codon:yes gene_type:complete
MTEYIWPPTDEQILTIASSALNQSKEKDVKVLVFWDNPTLIIFDPIYFGRTEYVIKKLKTKDRSIEVNIGRED